MRQREGKRERRERQTEADRDRPDILSARI